MSDNRSAFSGSHIFGRIKTETTDVTKRPDWFPFPLCSMRLGTIFDQQKIVFSNKRDNLIHIASLTEKMNNQQRFDIRISLKCLLDFLRINIKSIRSDIGKNRSRSSIYNGIGRGNK